jgi:hypothetical protein
MKSAGSPGLTTQGMPENFLIFKKQNNGLSNCSLNKNHLILLKGK